MRNVVRWAGTALVVLIRLHGVPRAALAEEARPPLQQPPASDMASPAFYKAYEQGKLEEARRLLLEFVRGHLDATVRIDGIGPLDVQRKLGISVAAEHVWHCLEMEAKYAPKGRVPIEVIEAGHLVMPALDKALAHARNAPKGDERTKQCVAYAERTKVNLILKEVAAWRNAGDRENAKKVAQQFSAYLAEQGIRAENLVAEPVPPDQTKAHREDVAPGATLGICQLLVRYYDALVAEDAGALDRCLLVTPGSMSGKDMVGVVARWRQEDGNFEGLGPVRFDSKTSLLIMPDDGPGYEVQCAGVLKHSRSAGKLIVHRETEAFLIRIVDGEFKILLRKGKGDRP